jgi:hypothetical protein
MKYLNRHDSETTIKLSKNTQSKICPVCGIEFFKPYGIGSKAWGARRTCSKKCSAKKADIDIDAISSMYIDKKISTTEIAVYCGVTGASIARRLKASGVKLRDNFENKKISHSRVETKQRLSEAAKGRHIPESAKVKLRLITGPKNANWRSGLTITSSGYLQFTASKGNGAHAGTLLHKIIAEWKYGRKVRHGEHVHHIDRNKLNNSPNNLIIISSTDHAKLHTEERENGKRSESVQLHR